MARAAGIALERITQSIHLINEHNLVIASASEEQAQEPGSWVACSLN